MTSPSRPGGFEGDLEALSVVEIVQTLNLGGKTARLILRSSSGTGTMWFRDGAMTHAAAGQRLGELAVYDMIEWTTGRFLVEYGITSESLSIVGDTTHLLLEALRRADERSWSSASSAECVAAPSALDADARRERHRRLALGGTAVAMVVLAIVLAAFRGGPSSSAATAETPVVAPVVAHDPAASLALSSEAPSFKRPAPVHPRSKKANVAAPSPPVVAPEPQPVSVVPATSASM